ncbi:MAG: S41 family peptidase [Candidatus Gygaella obscura]|nr:S41 family peptidase [Candidatus Gygaella obscura]
MKIRRKTILIFLTVCFFSVLTVYGLSGVERKNKENTHKKLSIFSDALAIVESEYVDETDSKDLIYGALKGLLGSLDAHSQFLDPDEYNELKIDTVGEFGGLGIEITIKDGLLTVITPIMDTPAWDAEIKPNDRIVKIEDELTKDITLQGAVKKLRGKPGTKVKITVWRESEERLFDIEITRDIIKIEDIKQTEILEDNIGYIKLVEFRVNTDKSFKTALNKLLKQGMDSFILDLRNNPGGLLDTALKVTDFFLKPNKIIVTTNNRQGQIQEYKSKTKDSLPGMPIVVLINEGSASGSEIVAGTLQDYERAIIAGVKSFGKGSVQSVVPLGDGSALRLTTSKYFTPLGRSMHNAGIEPDIEIKEAVLKTEDKKINDDDLFLKIKEIDENKTKDKFNYKDDIQLMRSVDLIKGIKIFKEKKNNG